MEIDLIFKIAAIGIIVAVYLLYFLGVSGGATNQELITDGAPKAFTNIFGNVLGKEGISAVSVGGDVTNLLCVVLSHCFVP